MPKISRDSATDTVDVEGYSGRFAELDGFTIGFETYTEDADLAPFFAGLPDDRCQCPHWGVVLRGKLTYRYADGREDVITAGEAYYAYPGHTPMLYAGTEVIEFSSTDQLEQTMEVVTKNMEALG